MSNGTLTLVMQIEVKKMNNITLQSWHYLALARATSVIKIWHNLVSRCPIGLIFLYLAC